MRIIGPSVALMRTQADPEHIDCDEESIPEHAVACLRLVTDRSIMHELMRDHPLASYTHESIQFYRYDKGIRVIQPSALPSDEYEDWHSACYQAELSYLGMLDRGVHPQAARSVLPICLAIMIEVTANFREWQHILRLKFNARAHPDMRRLMRLVLDVLHPLSPACFDEFNV